MDCEKIEQELKVDVCKVYNKYFNYFNLINELNDDNSLLESNFYLINLIQAIDTFIEEC